MKEKIEWYQEVLELEPGSKVFFPLARLLADSGQLDKAAKTLRHGLDRHPEFIEARLYLIDLLFRHGRLEQCEDQVAQLAPLFSRYEGFWQAWGSSMAATGREGDAGLALKFLAAAFQHRSLSLSDVLSRGLDAVLPHGEASAPTMAQPSHASSSSAAMGAPCGSSQASAQSAVHASQTSPQAPMDATTQAPRGPVPSAAVAAALAPLADIVQSLPTEPRMMSPEKASSDKTFADKACPDKACPDKACPDKAFADTAFPAQTSASDMADALAQSGDTDTDHDANALPVLHEQCELSRDYTQDEALDDMDMQDDGDEAEERFSLRTRSMAEVLAEQGDFAGALEIYQELSSQASSPEEAADLQYRISTLTAHLGAAQEPAPAPEPVTSPGKHRVLTVLEALAERLENRVHG